MTQSRRASLLESAANIAIGYGVAVAAQVAIFPLFGMDVPLGRQSADRRLIYDCIAG